MLLIPALIVGTLAIADQHKFEVSPMIGYNFAEGNLNVKDNGYLVGGLEVQFNTPGSKISPEFSLLYSDGVDYKTGGDTSITRGAFNGVYTFDGMDSIVPFAKAGVGYERVGSEVPDNESGLFLDAGAGLKVPFTDNIALKLEAIYMAKLGGNNSGSADSNLVTMAGLTFAFGGEEQKPAPIVEEEVVVVVVDGDDDNDGVLNSIDKCPDTKTGVKVDAVGCAIPVVNPDLDNDGVLNENDLCPDTRPGAKVNSDGCPKVVNLHVNFETDSAVVPATSTKSINVYADFLTTNTNYTAKIVGHTDSTGSEAYNQKLSEKRANSVKENLVERGVDAKQITTLGKGETAPVASNTTAQGRAENRRIEAELTRH